MFLISQLWLSELCYCEHFFLLKAFTYLHFKFPHLPLGENPATPISPFVPLSYLNYLSCLQSSSLLNFPFLTRSCLSCLFCKHPGLFLPWMEPLSSDIPFSVSQLPPINPSTSLDSAGPPTLSEFSLTAFRSPPHGVDFCNPFWDPFSLPPQNSDLSKSSPCYYKQLGPRTYCAIFKCSPIVTSATEQLNDPQSSYI